jgi:hypothetical protein
VRSMRERAEAVGGTLGVTSADGQDPGAVAGVAAIIGDVSERCARERVLR